MAVGYAGYASYGTPEAIEKKRRIADQLAMAGLGRAPKDVGEGLNAIGQALIARSMMDEITGAETSGRKSAADAFSSLFGGSGTPGASSGAGGVSTPPSVTTDYPSQRVAQAHDGGAIKAKLVDRGLPEHVADAFVMNFQDESGLNPGINEQNPTVPGSRGGFGLYQLTGPRRRAYEAYAAERGLPLDSVDAQLDFMMTELQGPEASAFKSIMAAPDTGSAATAIVKDFLRPAPEHQASRSARYLKTGGQQVASLDPSIGMETLPMPAMAPGVTQPDTLPMPALPQGVDPSAMADPLAGKGPRITPVQAAPDAGMGAPGTPVTETPEGRRALAAMLSGQPMTGGAPMPMQGAPAAPQVSPAQQQIAQQLTNLPVMAGGNADALSPQQAAQAGSFPAAPPQPQARAQMGQGGQPSIQQIMQVMSNPWLSDSQKQIAGVLLEQQIKQADPLTKLQLEKARLDIEKARNPELPNEVQEYEYAKRQGFEGSFVDFQLAQKKASATTVTTNVGGGDKFYDELDKKQAEVFSGLSDAGIQGRSKLAQIDSLEQVLAQAETGGLAVVKQFAGEYGINTEGLSDIQAAQAMINRLVPEQRQPGSGPMSDRDLELFKAALPRLINQPGGNQTIINTMRGITQYQIQMGEIADAVADRSMTPTEARKAIRELENPLAGFGKEKPKQEGQQKRLKFNPATGELE